MESPEFPKRITAKVWRAAFSRLDIPKFREFFSGGLAMAETEDIYFFDSWTPPALLMLLGPLDLDPLASGRSEQTTVLEIVLAWSRPRSPRETGDELRPRVLDEIRATLAADHGVLIDDEGQRVTEALTRFQRLPAVVGVPNANPQYLLDRLRVAYRSIITPDFQLEG